MTRSYVFVLLAVFGLFFLQLYGKNVPYGPFISIGLIGFIIVLTIFQLKRKPNH